MVGAPRLRLALGPQGCLPSLTAHFPCPLSQWSGLRAGVGCDGADRELALGPPSESSFLFFPPLSPWAGRDFPASSGLSPLAQYLAPWGVFRHQQLRRLGRPMDHGLWKSCPWFKSQLLSLLAC